MASELRLSPRERTVLTAIVETYIATGEPVASQAVARHFGNKDGMSSATIRNVMASLGEAGLLDQPHTSAGRIPTAQAFRFYVEHLAGRRSRSSTPERMEQIEESFAGIGTSEQYLERTSHVLALISSGLGVALASTQELHTLEHIHFSRLAAGRVLGVRDHQVGQRSRSGAAARSRPRRDANWKRRPATSTRISMAGRSSAFARRWPAVSKPNAASTTA